jgi:hypothetical protein
MSIRRAGRRSPVSAEPGLFRNSAGRRNIALNGYESLAQSGRKGTAEPTRQARHGRIAGDSGAGRTALKCSILTTQGFAVARRLYQILMTNSILKWNQYGHL